MSESKIIINGHELNQAQVMTIRIALSAFSVELHDECLGKDKMGKLISSGYQLRIREIDNMVRPREMMKVS